MKKILLVTFVVGAVAAPSLVYAQPTSPVVTPMCSLDPTELAKTPKEDELLKYQASLKSEKMGLESLALDLKALPGVTVERRKELEASIAGLSDRIELHRIALAYVQTALASYAKRQDNIADCESALRRRALIERIAAPESDPAERKVVLEAAGYTIATKMDAAKEANDELAKAGSSAIFYAKLSLGGAQIVRQAEANVVQVTREGDPCQYMISDPDITLDVGKCGGDARIRSVRSFAGGDVDFPSSVLRPRGFTAKLAGSSLDGTVAINVADSFKFRRTPKERPANPEGRVQLPWEFGYSFGVTAKDGLIFARKDVEKLISDNIDGEATFKGGLFFNVYEGVTRQGWEDSAAKLKEAAIKACRKDQASGESMTPSTCAGQSLTQWVYDVNEKGTLRRPELAKQADDLYFRSQDDKPVWGGGFNFSVSRSKFDYLDPAVFIANPTSKNQSDGGLNYATTVFGYWRLNPTSSKWDWSAIPSLSYSSRFGYDDDTKQMQFCPAVPTGTPFVTGGCPSYHTAAPTRIWSWTPAIEVRILTPRYGPIPSFGVSPKLSFERIDGSTADRWRLALPALAFVEKEAGLGVGLEYSHEWGGRLDTANAKGTFDIPNEDTLKIVVTKTFSLTGN